MDKQIPLSDAARAEEQEHDGIHRCSRSGYQRLMLVTWLTPAARTPATAAGSSSMRTPVRRRIRSAVEEHRQCSAPGCIIITHGTSITSAPGAAVREWIRPSTPIG